MCCGIICAAVLIYILLIATNVEHVLIDCLDIFFHEMPLQGFWLLKQVSVLVLLVYGSSSNVLIMNLLLDICNANIFPTLLPFHCPNGFF